MRHAKEVIGSEIITSGLELERPPGELRRVTTGRPSDAAPNGLRRGRTLELSTDGAADVLTIKSESGNVELAISLTDDGPRLSFASAELVLTSTRDVRVDCDRFIVKTKRELVQRVGGDLIQQVGNELRTTVRGKLTTKSLEAHIEATRGNVHLEANDDVRLLGERIKLNC